MSPINILLNPGQHNTINLEPSTKHCRNLLFWTPPQGFPLPRLKPWGSYSTALFSGIIWYLFTLKIHTLFSTGESLHTYQCAYTNACICVCVCVLMTPHRLVYIRLSPFWMELTPEGRNNHRGKSVVIGNRKEIKDEMSKIFFYNSAI